MCNRRVKFGLKIPNRLGKMSENLRGGIFLTRTVDYIEVLDVDTILLWCTWMKAVINGNGECSLLAAYRQACGSGQLVWSRGQQPLTLFLHLSREPVELSLCSKHDDSTIKIIIVIRIIIFNPWKIPNTHLKLVKER